MLSLVNGSAAGVGVDQELISAIPSHNPTFLSRNVTPKLPTATPNWLLLCLTQRVGLEKKLCSVPSKGAGAAMLDIEVLSNQETSAPEVMLHGDAKKATEGKGIKNFPPYRLSRSPSRRHSLYRKSIPPHFRYPSSHVLSRFRIPSAQHNSPYRVILSSK